MVFSWCPERGLTNRIIQSRAIRIASWSRNTKSTAAEAESDPSIGVDARVFENAGVAVLCALSLERGEGQAQEPHRFGIVLNLGPSEELSIEEHFRELVRLVGHLSSAVRPFAPDVGGELAKLGLLCESVYQLGPGDRFGIAGKLRFDASNVVSEFRIVAFAEARESLFKFGTVLALWTAIFLHCVVKECSCQVSFRVLLKLCRQSRGSLTAIGERDRTPPPIGRPDRSRG